MSSSWVYATLAVIVSLIALGFVAVNSALEERATRDEIPEDLLITMRRDPCFGFCPIYSVTVYGNGTVVYEGEHHVNVKGKRVYQISDEKIMELLVEFERADYFSLKDRYEAPVTDLPATATSITMEGETKSVYNYHGAPEKLHELEDRIDEITGVKELVSG